MAFSSVICPTTWLRVPLVPPCQSTGLTIKKPKRLCPKGSLFEAVCVTHAEAAMQAIIKATADQAEPFEALVTGSIAWIDYMLKPPGRQILIVDAPTVLGWQRWQQLDDRYSTSLLRQGVQEALNGNALTFTGNAEFLTVLINGALNAVALKAGSQNDLDDWTTQLRYWFEGMRG